MSMRLGVVVETHPEDHSVDLVMTDDGSRLTGVQIMTMNGSTRSGTIDMPAVPLKANKWDISQRTDQDQIAVVSYISRQPVVVGFLYPQINQMLWDDPKRFIYRHQSDVQMAIDGGGNIQLEHPNGTYVRIAEEPDRENTERKNADSSLQLDRNTDRKVNVRIGLAGNVVVLTMTPDGDVTLLLNRDLSINAGGKVSVKAAGDISIESETHISLKAPRIDWN